MTEAELILDVYSMRIIDDPKKFQAIFKTADPVLLEKGAVAQLSGEEAEKQRKEWATVIDEETLKEVDKFLEDK